MEVGVIVAIGLLFVLAFVAGAYVLNIPIFPGSGGSAGSKAQIRNIVTSQRETSRELRSGTGAADLLKTADEASVHKTVDSKLTLQKKLKYAQLRFPPLFFRLCEVLISVVAAMLVSLHFNKLLTAIALMTGPVFMGWLVNFFMGKRFKRFDRDYPAFLLSLVSLLKTGMNVMPALQTAAKGLEEESLVREEVQLMSERLRFGVPEDKSIGSFGEDIYHPEIELFVQALLLSRRVGGNLSDTLDRLAKQVRKRQYFRQSAVAAIGMQRGSIWIIILIMVGMLGYLYLIYPEAILAAWNDEGGWTVWQVGMVFILLGVYWIRQVTKFKV